jgi:serine phosphatase RsbU (regulator of sigma subunit)
MKSHKMMYLFLQKLHIFLATIFTFFTFLTLQAQTPFVLENSTTLSYIGHYLLIYEDPNANLSINQILQSQYQQQFTPCLQETPSHNLTKSAIWSKFIVQNQSNEIAYLQINTGFLDDIQLYGIDVNNKVSLLSHTGDRQIFNSRQFLLTQFVFELPHTYTHFYLRIETQGSMLFPLKIGKLSDTVEYLHKWDMAQGFYLGLCFMILIYNILIYSKIREKLYLIYCLYILAVIIGTGQISGLNFEWLWQNTPAINAYENIIYSVGILSVLFTTAFLKSEEHTPRLHNIFYLSAVLYPIAVIINIAGFHMESNFIIQLATFANSILSILMAAIVAWRGYKPARYFFVAWSFVLGGSIIFILTLLGDLPANSFTINAIQIGSAVEMILLSVAIAEKISDIQAAKEEAEATNLSMLAKNEKLIKQQFVLLERKVQERTFELQQTKEEVMLQNQELREKQDEILLQNNLIFQQKHDLQRQNEKISEGIRASFAIQKGILPSKDELTKWLQEYFVLYQPKDIVSGDLYWFAAWEEDDGTIKKIIAAIDCTGHGVQGALTSMIARTLFDEVVLIKLQDNPALILEQVNQKIHSIFDRQNKHQVESGMDVGLCVCTYQPNSPTIQVTFAGAKRPLFYVLPNSKTTEVVQGSRKSIGGKQIKNFENQYLSLPVDTMLYLSSDGFSDQNNSNRTNFGLANLQNLFAEIAPKPSHEQKEILQTTLNNFMEGTEQRDDILLFGIRLKAI